MEDGKRKKDLDGGEKHGEEEKRNQRKIQGSLSKTVDDLGLMSLVSSRFWRA